MKNPKIQRERELNELSKKAVKIFEEKLNSIEKLKQPEKVGEVIITKEADAIIYQVDSEEFNLNQRKMSFEIGLGDPKDREDSYIHINIELKTKEIIEKNK